jgi:aspartate racemase
MRGVKNHKPGMKQFKKIGIVGGVSWISTVEYYKAICEMSHQYQCERLHEGPPPIPEIAIESLNINKSVSLRGKPGNAESWQAFEAYFRDALNRLVVSGVDFAIIASNTPHNRLENITEGIDIPVISIFEEVAKLCSRNNLNRVLILGTEPTMSSQVFPSVLSRHGITGILPEAGQDQDMVISLIDQLQGAKKHNAAEQIQSLAEKYLSTNSNKLKAVCLSCTELPLAFPEHLNTPMFIVNGVTYLNTTWIHAKAAFDYAISIDVT